MASLPADPSEIIVSVHTVTYDGDDLGFSDEGSVVTFTREVVKVTSDQSGRNVPIDVRVVGVAATAKLNLLQPNQQNLKIVFEEGNLFTDPGTPQPFKLTFGDLPGKRLTGKKLVLHPTQNAANDKSLDIVFHRAVSVEPVEMNFQLDEATKIPVTFEALFDDTKVDGNKMFLIGDEDVT